MRLENVFAFAVLMAASQDALACKGPFPLIGVQVRVNERSPDRVATSVTHPLERHLIKTPRIAGLNSTTGDGSVEVEMRFDGGATADDLALVRQRIGEMRYADGVEVKSTKVFFTSACWQRRPLGPPSP